MKLSVIIPVYNEVENVDEMHAALQAALTTYDYELILVDDGSTDGTVARLEALAAGDPQHTCIVEFRRNFGQTAAIAAGIDTASGE